MKIRKGSYEVEGSPAEVAELLRHLDGSNLLGGSGGVAPLNRRITPDDVWSIREDSLRDFVRHHPWSGPGAVAEHFFGRSVLSTGDDRSIYYALYRRIGDARRFWNQTDPGWNEERGPDTRSSPRSSK